MRNIAKRSVAMLLLMVMVFSCFSNALTVTFASEASGTDPIYFDGSVHPVLPVCMWCVKPFYNLQNKKQD